MTTAVAAYTSQRTAHPYITAADYTNAPTSVDTSNLVYQGDAAQQTAELWNVIRRAGAWMDQYCGQTLWATVDIENARIRADRYGSLKVHPKHWPILEVRDVEFGAIPTQVVAMTDLSSVWIEEQQFVIPTASSTSFVGALNLTSPRPGGELFVRWSYVNGWPDTQITSNISVGASTITVTDSTGIYGGAATIQSALSTPPASVLTIYDGTNTETVSVASVSGNTLTLNAVTQFAHTASASAPLACSALPAGVRAAAIYATSAMIKTRGNEAIEMSTAGGPGHVVGADGVAQSDLAQARELLRPYRRMR